MYLVGRYYVKLIRFYRFRFISDQSIPSKVGKSTLFDICKTISRNDEQFPDRDISGFLAYKELNIIYN